MRTDVKLGVAFALVMVLAAGGYFMFRGEKQTPISLADKNPGQEIKTQPGKPGTAVKPTANQPKAATTNGNRPQINPKSLANNTNVPTKPVSPVGTTAMNKPIVATPPAGPSDVAANPATISPTPSNTTPGGPAGASPLVATNVNPITSSNVDRPAPATTTLPTNTPTSSSAATPVVPNTGLAVGLTGIPNNASQPGDPARATGNMSPLSNSPSMGAPSTSPSTSPVTMTGTNNALPPGIRTATAPKADTSSDKKVERADAAVETHKVQAGDSLSSLAQTYYGDSKYVKVLSDANPKLGDPTRLQVGSLVLIPSLPSDADSRTTGITTTTASAKPGDKPALNGTRTYTVKSGDSFYSIAKTQLGSASRWKELLALNNSTVNGDPTSLKPGQRLVLPESH